MTDKEYVALLYVECKNLFELSEQLRAELQSARDELTSNEIFLHLEIERGLELQSELANVKTSLRTAWDELEELNPGTYYGNYGRHTEAT